MGRLWILRVSRLVLLAVLGLLLACSTSQPRPQADEPDFDGEWVTMADGYRLPLRRWLPSGQPEAVVLGLHGFGDYGRAFAPLEPALVDFAGMALYAYDQRGFGATVNPGIWPGKEPLVADAQSVAALLRRRHPDIPLFVVGESMGAAVALLAQREKEALDADAAVLLAPAVWGKETMPWYQRISLWLARRLVPGLVLSGDSAGRLGIYPTDDPVVLRAMRQDPLVQGRASVRTLHGITTLMGDASRVESVHRPTLALYGLQDQVIPPRPVCRWLERLTASGPGPGDFRVALYDDGYHMLTRYTGSDRVIADIAAWLEGLAVGEPPATLPSGAGRAPDTAEEEVCGLE